MNTTASPELSTEQVKQLQNSLLQIEEELNELLIVGEEASNTVTLDQSKVGRVSRIDAMQQQEMALANTEAYRKKLTLVKIALKKIKSGDYGWCDECGEVIVFRRLEIRPESPLCINCQSQSELR